MTSYKVFLMMKASTGSSYSKLVDIKDFPDLFGTPEALDKTTLSDRSRVYEQGIEENEVQEYTANYDLATFNTLRALKDTENDYAIWFGGTEDAATGVVTPTGSEGKFNFKGKLAVGILGKGVNEIVEMKITIAPTTPISIDASQAS